VKWHRSNTRAAAIAAVLRGAWRSPSPPLDIPDDQLAQSVPLLIRSGVGAIAWWRIRQSTGPSIPLSYRRLLSVYRRYALEAAAHEMETVKLFRRMRAFNVDPILLKGCVVGRAYPEPGLRPCGDIDLLVATDQYQRAKAALATREASPYPADLCHDVMARFSESSFEQIHSRSQVVPAQGVEIRIPSAEDHLRFLSLHMLKHGVSRPFWLLDIAVALESRPKSFNWDLCLGENQRHRRWILSAIALASRLLGADTTAIPVADTSRALSDRFSNRVLKQWEAGFQSVPPKFFDEVRSKGWTWETLKAIRHRWPSSIQATVDQRGSLDAISALPYQLLDCICRSAKLMRSRGTGLLSEQVAVAGEEK
jgi:hypothetical protein